MGLITSEFMRHHSARAWHQQQAIPLGASEAFSNGSSACLHPIPLGSSSGRTADISIDLSLSLDFFLTLFVAASVDLSLQKGFST